MRLLVSPTTSTTPTMRSCSKGNCARNGIECEMYGTKASGLPQLPKGVSIEQKVMSVFCKAWKMPVPK